MGLFGKKQRVEVCDVCGATGHDLSAHVAQIRGDEPSWLPAGWRRQAQGEFTFLCTKCNSFPDSKWPNSGGAEAGLQIHLGSKHYVGLMKGARQDFGMLSANATAASNSSSASARPEQRPAAEPTQPAAPAPSAARRTPAAPAFDDPTDTSRWQMVHSAHAAVTEMMDKNQECYDKAEYVEKAFALADTDVVNGVRQAEISKGNFRRQGLEWEGELHVMLAELRAVTARAQDEWNTLLRSLSAAENDMMAVMTWCMSHGVDSEVSSGLIANGMLIHTDFGLTRASFWAETQRINDVMGGAAQ